MTLAIRSIALLIVLLSAITAAAAVPQFGQPVPLTDTRYSGIREYTSDFFAPITPVIRSNGTDAYLFNFAENRLQVARIVEGEPRVPQLVFPFFISSVIDFDVVWTGEQFLAIAKDQQNGYRMFGRLIDASGMPLGEPFPIGEVAGTFPKLAFNGRKVLFLYSSLQMEALVLTPDGQITGAPQQVTGRVVSEPGVVTSNGDTFAAILWTGDAADDLVLFDSEGQVTSKRPIDSVARLWALASDGDRYLAVNALSSRAKAHLLDRNGTLLNSLDLDTSGTNFHRNPLAAWSGSGWVVSTVASNIGRVLHLDSGLQSITSTETFPNTQVGLAQRDGRVLGLWWSNLELLAHELPRGSGTGRLVAQQAAPQGLMATASSVSASLFIWAEDVYRIGIRRNDGSWSERTIDINPTETLLAASNGTAFVIISDNQVIHLDEAGVETLRGTIGMFAFGIAWNGTHYGLLGFSAGRVVSAMLNGVSATPVTLPASAEASFGLTLESSGSGFLATWVVRSHLCDPPPCAWRIEGLRLNADLTPNGEVFSIYEGPLVAYSMAWAGDRFVIGYSGGNTIDAIEVTVAGAVENGHRIADATTDGSSPRGVTVVPAVDGVVVGWVLAAGSDQYRFLGASLSRTGVVSSPRIIHEELVLGSGFTAILFSANGRLGFTWSAAHNDAPHYGSRRLMLSLAEAGVTAAPEAPQATLVKNDSGATLTWTRPAGSVNGYRVERRIGDDAWTDVGSWIAPTTHSLAVTIPVGRSVAYRVRAFNDAGVSARSKAAQLEPLRRRAAR